MIHLVHDKSVAAFRHVNRLARATGLPTYSPRQVSALQTDGGVCCLVAALPRFQRSPAGFLLYRLIVPEAEIYDLAVHPLWQKCGLGALLWRTARHHMRQAGATECRLEVRRSNAAARRFYNRHDFGEYAVRRGYYREPPEDALLLIHHLSREVADR